MADRLIPKTATNLKTGLTAAQVADKTAAGQTNVQIKKLSRSIPQIIGANLFTLFNLLNLVIAILIFMTGSYRNLFFMGPVLVNIVIGSYQEIRAKLRIDRLNMVNQQTLTVLRDGQSQQVALEALVLDDLVLLKRGETVPADGIVQQTTGLQVDESGLTGEADSIAKKSQDPVYSGSFVVAGQGLIQLTQVGLQSFTAQLSNAVSQKKPRLSVLLRIINRIIRVLTYTIIPLGLLLFFRTYGKSGSFNDAILGTAASVIGMIPEGLVLLTSIALATGAYNLTKKRILVRSLNAIETLARVDTLCLDKTGTITTGQLTVKRVLPIAADQVATVTAVASKIVAATAEQNATAQAIQALAVPPLKVDVAEVLPFSSETKASGFVTTKGVRYLMGAPAFIIHDFHGPLKQQAQDAAAAGYRVLAVVAEQAQVAQEVLGLILIADQVRPQAKGTFDYLRSQGVALKIISGDDPVTVVNVARQAGIEGAAAYVDMSSLPAESDYQVLAQRYQVFGRVRPEQKAKLIKAMQANGLTVGMTGDGVNDVLAMRQSDCSIAMAGESEAAEATANFVLLDHNFESLLFMLNEGRRVINNVERVASLYLIKTIYSVVLSLFFIILGTVYPFQLSQLTPVNALTVGIPTFFLALEPNYRPPAGRFMRNVMEIAAPAAICDILLLIGISVVGHFNNWQYLATSTMSVFAIGAIGFCALLAISRPYVGRKLLLIGLSILTFLATFIFSTTIFGLQAILTWPYVWYYLGLLLLAWPLFLFMREVLGRRVFSKVKWR
ncbi:HAD-IC family P-type ATPase [Lapidilactobacillus luobeiensis]|uniref:HAD-IC family P-type ATPase n=1 Tax=Lapidilactobacillus luobeiensis TaxID=2950371 RepID=UPI0021C3FF4E|nr:HAD-IC family P-type ATPase [Lapidilactobacillus luobeiensis]